MGWMPQPKDKDWLNRYKNKTPIYVIYKRPTLKQETHTDWKWKTRDLLKKIRDTKGIFQAKIGSIKDRNGMDLTEAEDIKKRWQEYTEELYKTDLHNSDNHHGVISNLESDILECEVR